MNLLQQREAVRRRRLVSRGVQQLRQRHFDEVRLGLVASRMMARPLPDRDTAAQFAIDDPMATRLVKGAIVMAMAGLLAQFHSPLLAALLTLLPGIG